MIEILIEHRNTPQDADKEIRDLIGKPKKESLKQNKGRAFTTKSKAEINIREMLKITLKCQICGGIVDLKQAVQYDHVNEFCYSQDSNPQNGRPTHPFCNLYREQIASLIKNPKSVALPALRADASRIQSAQQLSLFDAFPGQS